MIPIALWSSLSSVHLPNTCSFRKKKSFSHQSFGLGVTGPQPPEALSTALSALSLDIHTAAPTSLKRPADTVAQQLWTAFSVDTYLIRALRSPFEVNLSHRNGVRVPNPLRAKWSSFCFLFNSSLPLSASQVLLTCLPVREGTRKLPFAVDSTYVQAQG